MLTPEDIINVEFTKVLGGYKTSEVDDFLDKCVDTVSALNNEKATLNKKLEILAEKTVEYKEQLEAYRKDEDSIRSALLSAQRVGDTVVREANQKAELILEDARIKAEKVQETAQKQIVAERKELESIRKEVAMFREKILGMYKEHLALIGMLPEMPEEEKAEEELPKPSEPPVKVEEPEQPAEPIEVQEPITVPVQETVSIVPPEDDMTIAPAEELFSNSDETERPSRFKNLKFGEEYDISSDSEAEQPRSLFRHKNK